MAERRGPVSLRAASRLTGDAQMLDDHPGCHHQQRRDPLIFGKREDVSEQTPERFARSFGQRRIGRMAVRGRRKLARPLPGLSKQVNSEVLLRQLELTRLLRRIQFSALSGVVVRSSRPCLHWVVSNPDEDLAWLGVLAGVARGQVFRLRANVLLCGRGMILPR
jgi:hypothetical protein